MVGATQGQAIFTPILHSLTFTLEIRCNTICKSSGEKQQDLFIWAFSPTDPGCCHTEPSILTGRKRPPEVVQSNPIKSPIKSQIQRSVKLLRTLTRNILHMSKKGSSAATHSNVSQVPHHSHYCFFLIQQEITLLQLATTNLPSFQHVLLGRL